MNDENLALAVRQSEEILKTVPIEARSEEMQLAVVHQLLRGVDMVLVQQQAMNSAQIVLTQRQDALEKQQVQTVQALREAEIHRQYQAQAIARQQQEVDQVRSMVFASNQQQNAQTIAAMEAANRAAIEAAKSSNSGNWLEAYTAYWALVLVAIIFLFFASFVRLEKAQDPQPKSNQIERRTSQ